MRARKKTRQGRRAAAQGGEGDDVILTDADANADAVAISSNRGLGWAGLGWTASYTTHDTRTHDYGPRYGGVVETVVPLPSQGRSRCSEQVRPVGAP